MTKGEGKGDFMEVGHLEEKTIEINKIYDGVIFEVTHDTVMLENGEKTGRDVVHHSGGVCVLPVDNEGNCYLVKQYRYPFNSVLLEAPAGKINKGETNPLDCGKRELEEEVGAIAGSYKSLGVVYPSVAYLTEKIYLFLATDLSFTQSHTDEDEFLDVIKMPLAKAHEMVLNNEIPDSKTQIVILKAMNILNK